MGVIELVQGVAEGLRRTLRELVEADVTHRLSETVGAESGVIAHRLQVNVLAHDGDLERFLYSFPFELQHNGTTRHAAQQVTYFAHHQTLGALAVHGQDPVSGFHSCALRRLAFIGIDGISRQRVFVHFALAPFAFRFGQGALLNNTTNTAVLAGGQHAQVLVVLLGIIHRIGVDLTEHGVDRGLRQIFVIECVHIIDIDLAQHVVEDRDALVCARRGAPLLRVEDAPS